MNVNKERLIKKVFQRVLNLAIKFFRLAYYKLTFILKKIGDFFVAMIEVFFNEKNKMALSKAIHHLIFIIKDLATFTTKPLRHVSHLSVMIILFLILAISPFSLVIKSQKLLDPFGANKAVEKEEKPDKSEEYQIAATLASIMDESLAEDAFKKANEVNQAVSFSIPMTATYALAKPVITGSINPANKEVFKKYIVQAGDTLWTIARDHEITTDSIRWANADITDIDAIKPGTELLIPSTVGVLYTVKEGESIEGIASKYGISVAMIESYNNIIDEELTPGMKIMIPDATGPEYIKPEPQETRVASDYDSSYNDAPSYIEPSSGPNRFPYGYCTWWVAHKRYVPWNGNAWQWYGNAIAYGYAVGDMPVTGAILVTWESYVGHVAYVESVNGDGSFNISEMNYVGWGRSSSRTVTTGSVPFIGFIY